VISFIYRGSSRFFRTKIFFLPISQRNPVQTVWVRWIRNFLSKRLSPRLNRKLQGFWGMLRGYFGEETHLKIALLNILSSEHWYNWPKFLIIFLGCFNFSFTVHQIHQLNNLEYMGLYTLTNLRNVTLNITWFITKRKNIISIEKSDFPKNWVFSKYRQFFQISKIIFWRSLQSWRHNFSHLVEKVFRNKTGRFDIFGSW
jgi:hypothetical protein